MNGDIDEDDLFLLAPEMRAKCREITNENPQRWNLATPTKIDLNKHATLSRKLQKFVEKQLTPAQKAQVKLSSVSEETLDGRSSSNGSRSLVSSTNSDKSNLSPRTPNDQSALQNALTLPMKKEKKHVMIADPEPKDQADGAKKSVMTQSAHPALTTTPLSRKMSAGNERENLRNKDEISPMTALTIQLDGLNLQKPTTSASATFPMSLQEQSNRIASVSHTASLNEINELARQQEEALRRMASLSGLAPTRLERASRLPKPTIRSGIPQPGFTGKRPLSARSTSAHPPEYLSSLQSAKVEQQQQRSGAFTARSAASTPRGRLRAPSAHTPHRLRPLQLHPGGVACEQHF